MMTADPDWPAGIAVLGRLAKTADSFSVNDCRDELRALGFARSTTGRLFRMAEAAGVIRQVGLTRSSDKRTRSRVAAWAGVEVVTSEVIAVRRDSHGRFTAGSAAGGEQQPTSGPSLIDFMEGSA